MIWKARYRCGRILRNVSALPFWLLLNVTNVYRIKGEHAGIRLLDLTKSRHDPKEFFLRTASALDLIRELDSLRYTRVMNEIRTIANIYLLSLARYQRLGRICSIDFWRFPWTVNSDFSLKRYACTLIHEATHGKIESHRILYSEANRARIERLCVLESMRFARHFEDSKVWEERFKQQIKQVGSVSPKAATVRRALEIIQRHRSGG